MADCETYIRGSDREGYWWGCPQHLHTPNQWGTRKAAKEDAAKHRKDSKNPSTNEGQQ